MPIRTTETARVPEDISGRQRRMPVGGITWRHTFRALRHRNYRLFFWGQLVSLIGTWMQQTAMSWFVYQITNSKLLLGVVAAMGSAPMMLSSVWGGSLADRYPKRSILVATQTAQMICAFLLAAGVWAGFATPSFIIVIAALNGLAMGFDMPARQAFTVEMTSREDLLNAISLNSSIVNGARIIGPSVAGLLIGAFGVAMCFFLNGVTFIAVIAGLSMMRLPRFERPAHAVSAGEHAWNGIVYSIKHQRVRTILLLFLAVGVFGWSYTVLMPAFARDVLNRGANGYGILMSASGTGAFIGALVVATYGHLFTPRRLALGGVWLFSIALFALSLSRSFYFAMAFLFVAGFGMLLFFSTSNTVLQTIVPDEMRGRVMGVWSLVFGAMIPLGSLEAGAVAHWLGTPFALGLGAIICAASALVTLFAIRRRGAGTST
ncbi:MAG: MFS transporter [Verrucomicrobia bacterium]|nr:MAG: MFS transporter [Verrucomicrobiota bacterium]PYJ90238.1 MAG: MFS transporter [Verrucomicrobiota bacterium]PYK49778.1 MAG: MFS transporter [Verrucomicrobiota bacterium]PYL41862.1 MAG: MFS transporter [Verrucomicrobiota bacterium]